MEYGYNSVEFKNEWRKVAKTVFKLFSNLTNEDRITLCDEFRRILLAIPQSKNVETQEQRLELVEQGIAIPPLNTTFSEDEIRDFKWIAYDSLCELLTYLSANLDFGSITDEEYDMFKSLSLDLFLPDCYTTYEEGRLHHHII